MLELDKAGIAVAEYWTAMPPKAEFEHRHGGILMQAKERLECRKTLLGDDTHIERQIEHYLNPKDDDDK